jgi:hypothetical protein
MLKLGLCITPEFGNDALGQYLPQLNAPLVEWVNTPDSALGENGVLVKGDQLANLSCGFSEVSCQFY